MSYLHKKNQYDFILYLVINTFNRNFLISIWDITYVSTLVFCISYVCFYLFIRDNCLFCSFFVYENCIQYAQLKFNVLIQWIFCFMTSNTF